MNAIDLFHQRLHAESAALVAQAPSVGHDATAAALRDGIAHLSEQLSTLAASRFTFAPRAVAAVQSVSIGAALRIVDAAVAEAAGCTPDVLHELGRKYAESARLRHVAIFFAYRLTEASTTHLARHYGLKDHTSVSYARAKIAEQVRTGEFRGNPGALEARVRAALEAAGYRVPKARIAA